MPRTMMQHQQELLVKRTFLELASDPPLCGRQRSYSDTLVAYESTGEEHQSEIELYSPQKITDRDMQRLSDASTTDEELSSGASSSEERAQSKTISMPPGCFSCAASPSSVAPAGSMMYMMPSSQASLQGMTPMQKWQSGVDMCSSEASLEAHAAALEAFAVEMDAEAKRARAALSATHRVQLETRRRAFTEGCFEPTRNRSISLASSIDAIVDDHGLSSGVAGDAELENDDRTTLMFRNLPNHYTRAAFLDMLDSEGFNKDYSFVYLPTDFKSFAGFGYSFVNFAAHEGAKKAKLHFQNYNKWKVPSQKVCSVVWSGPVQGLSAHTDRYRNSPVMHESVPDEYKPVVFIDGVRVPFPPPTKRIRAPRARHGIVSDEGIVTEAATPARRPRGCA